MGYRVEHDAAIDGVRIVLEGALNMSDLEKARARAAQLMKELGLSRLLVDAISQETDMTVVDHFEFTSQHSDHQPPGIRTALIHDPADTSTFKFIETVAVNRGMETRRFTDQDAAVAWLLSP